MTVSPSGGSVAKVYNLSAKAIQHISKHIPSEFSKQVSYLTDEQLASKLSKTTFFNPKWTKDQVVSAVEEAYSDMMNKGVRGRATYTIQGETFDIVVKESGEFDTAFGFHKLTPLYFGR